MTGHGLAEGDFTSHMASTAQVLNQLQHGGQPVASHKERKGEWLLPGGVA